MRVLIFSALSVLNISFREELSEMWSKMCTGLHVMYPFFLSDFNGTWIFSVDFRKIFIYVISWKFVEWQPSCSVRTDRHTDVMKLIVAFRNFANVPKKWDTGIKQLNLLLHNFMRI